MFAGVAVSILHYARLVQVFIIYINSDTRFEFIIKIFGMLSLKIILALLN